MTATSESAGTAVSNESFTLTCNHNMHRLIFANIRVAVGLQNI